MRALAPSAMRTQVRVGFIVDFLSRTKLNEPEKPQIIKLPIEILIEEVRTLIPEPI
jgi:hypothetical protein